MSCLERDISPIIRLVNRIQKDAKIGTAYERYESQLLWDLGHEILEYGKFLGNSGDVVTEIIIRLQQHSIRCQPVMLKNAETILRIWPKKTDYINETKDVPYGKIRDAVKILNPDFIAQHKVTKKDRNNLIKRLSASTFEDFRSYIRKLRLKYDPLGETINFDEMFSEVHYAVSDLTKLVENGDPIQLEKFRDKFDINYIENSRKRIAAIKSESVFQKLKSDIVKELKVTNDLNSNGLETVLYRINKNMILLLESSETRRDIMRRRIGTSGIGKLSTLLKAASNEAEHQRYLRSRQILDRFITK